jgi:hypothetical protein
MNISHPDRQPLLVGLLIDVSRSMTEQVKNKSRGDTLSRLESIQNSLDDLVVHARSFYDDAEKAGRPFDLFALGFGFGNLRNTLLEVIGNKTIPAVRSLLTADGESPIIPGTVLLDRWKDYRRTIRDLASSMGGATPLVEALGIVERLFETARAQNRYGDPTVLLIVSDGLPTDPPKEPESGPAKVREACQRLRDDGVVIVSCFVTSTDSAQYKKLYREPIDSWDDGAKLMFDCASELASQSPFRPHLREHGWEAGDRAKLFAQINQSELLTEFVRLAIAPVGAAAQEGNVKPIKVFVSYCHHDAKYVSTDRASLLSYIRGLEHEGFEFWLDQSLAAGDRWDAEIKDRLEQADVALVLISQAFLNSKYCMTVEVPSFIQSRIKRGLRIIPVILSACDWSKHEWLSSTQAIPLDGKNVETHFSRPAQRKEFYLQVLREIRRSAQVRKPQPT